MTSTTSASCVASARGAVPLPPREGSGGPPLPSPPFPRLDDGPEPRIGVQGPEDALRALRGAAKTFVVVHGEPQGSVHDLPREQGLQAVQADRPVPAAEDGLHHVEGLEGRSLAVAAPRRRG